MTMCAPSSIGRWPMRAASAAASRWPSRPCEHLVAISAGRCAGRPQHPRVGGRHGWRRRGSDSDGDVPVSPSLEDIETAAQQRVLAYDRAGDGHYGTVSAFIKSMRGNDPDAALYWLATMVAAGEDPKFIARRIIIAASEDVGNADPRALQVAVAAAQALDWVGLPEAQYALAQAAVYVATAPEVEPLRAGLLGGRGRRPRARLAAGAQAPAERAASAACAATASASATGCPTTTRAPTWSSSTCPTRSSGGATTSRQTRAGRRASGSAWTR